LRFIYGATGNDSLSQAATALTWLIWQAPLLFLEMYAATWLLVTSRANQAFGLACLHVLLLVALLPVGALMAGATGAAWGTLAAQVVAAGVTFWFMRRSVEQQRATPTIR
jgi:Na+-driven multidrug efflux pump